MNWSDLGFFVCALVAIVSAMVLINQRQPVYSALAMLAMFLGLTGIFTLLNASFVAAMQIMVYGGAVIVVFLFVIMLLNYQPEELPQEKETGFKLFVAAACALLAVALGMLAGLGSTREAAKQPYAARHYQDITHLKAMEGAEPEPVGSGFLPLPSTTLQIQIDLNNAEMEQADKAKAAAEQALAAAQGKSPAELAAAKLQIQKASHAHSAIAAEQARLAKELAGELEFGSAKGVGKALFNQHTDKEHSRYTTSYLVPFELLSLLIVGAMLGAVMLSKPRLMKEPVTEAHQPGAGDVHPGAGHEG